MKRIVIFRNEKHSDVFILKEGEKIEKPFLKLTQTNHDQIAHILEYILTEYGVDIDNIDYT